MSASTPILRVGDFSSKKIISPPSFNEPEYGFDVGTAEYYISPAMISAGGSLNGALAAAGLSRGAAFSEGICSGGAFYINDINKSPFGDGVNARVGFRGYAGTLNGSGVGKFHRLPYSAGLEHTSTGGENARITLLREDGSFYAQYFNQQITFTDPAASFQDSYLANGTFFDPFDDTKSNLTVIGMGTNWGSDAVLSTDLKVRIKSGIGGYYPPGASIDQLPGTTTSVTLAKTGDTSWSDGTWALYYDSSDRKWRLTNLSINMDRYAHSTYGPEGFYEENASNTDAPPQDVDNIAVVGPDVDDGYEPDTPLQDWYKLNTETPVAQQFGFDWPFVRWRSRISSQNSKLTNFNLNWGIVLVNREAERVASNPLVELWHIVDTFQVFNQVTLR